MLRAVLYKEKDLRIEEIPIPEIGPDEVLIKNKISITCGTDVKTYNRGYPLLKPPHPFGHEYSGVIAKIGKDVNGFKEGDRVAVHNTAPCNECYYCKKGVPSMCENMLFNRGSYAEYVKVPSRIVKQNMFAMPDIMTHKTAALMEPLSCAVYGISHCPIELGDYVVVNGAGPIGLMFIRLAVMKGAKVIATDMTQSRLDLAMKLGAYKTVNMSSVTDGVVAVKGLTDNLRGADVVIEATGLVQVWNDSIKMARKGGFVLLFGGTKQNMLFEVDTTLLHYSQLTIKGVFHTTPRHVAEAFELLKMNVISSDDFIQNDYSLKDISSALEEHAAHKVIKNCIVYD